jgi:RNA polymerase sigma factor (sigma-70 family)
VPEKPPKNRVHTSRTRFFAPFWQTTTIALHSFSTIFSSSTHHPGLADIVKERNCRIRSRIYRKSVCGTATSAIWNITQQCWLEIIKGLGKLYDPKSFKAWAYRIATNRTIDWLKNKRKYQHINIESIEVDCNQKDNDSQVKKLVQRLKSDSRVILSLYYFEQLSISEISIALNIPSGTVKSRLIYGKRRIKKVMGKIFW